MRSYAMFVGVLFVVMGCLQAKAVAQSGQVTDVDMACDPPNQMGVTWEGTWDMGGCAAVTGFCMPYYHGTEPPVRVPIINPGTGGTAHTTVPLTAEQDDITYDLAGVYVWFEFGYWSGGYWYCQGCTDWCHMQRIGGGCFGKGTPLLTPEGAKPIEQIEVGDLVLSTNDDPKARSVTCRVEEVTQSRGRLMELEVAGRVVKVTREHPFYVRDKAWTPAGSLAVGDLLRSHDGRWIRVKSVAAKDNHDRVVYNLRLDKHSSYFVGDRDWGFSMWVRSECKKTKTRLK